MRNFTRFIFSKNFLYLILIAAEIVAIIFLCLFLPAFLPVAAAFTAAWLVTLITVIAAVGRGGSAEINSSLVLLIIALPVAGALIFAFSRLGKRKCGVLEVEGLSRVNGLEAAAYKCCGTGGVDYERAVYFKDGGEYFDALFKAIANAKKSVYLEYYILCRGKIFNRLLTALRTAKSNGAEIKILIDGIGSAFKAGRKELKKLRALGAEVKIFHRLTPLVYSRLNFRDHRKIAAVDGKAAFTGGFNIADEYANIDSPHGYWKDTGVAVYGSAAAVFEGLFLAVWNGRHEMTAEVRGGKRCIPYYDSPPVKSCFMENSYVSAISSAERRVHILTPYFCPDERITAALVFAAARGVDVRIIIPHVPDKRYTFELSKSSAEPLIARGIKIYEYTPGFMHAKSMVCDDNLFIGSYNFDFRSMRLNFECGVVLDGDVCERAERDFWECQRLSSPILVEKLPFYRRAYRFVLKLFAPLM